MRVAGMALWRQIATELEDEIRDRRLLSGAKLPTEMELAQRFGVNRHTVRRAVGALEDAGLVRAERGRGTFVQTDMLDYRLDGKTRFSENILRANRQPSGDVLRAEKVPARGTAAKELGVRAGTPVYVIETLRGADETPIGVGKTYFPARLFPAMPERFREHDSITRVLESYGMEDYRRKLTRVTARPADAFEQKHLRLSRHQPVLVAEAVDSDPDGKPISYGIARFAADRIQFVIEP